LLLSKIGQSQTPQDLGKEPRLQQLVSFHAKRVLLPDLLKQMHDQTHQKFLLDSEMQWDLACAFVDQKPVWVVMKGLADTFGGYWTDQGSGWRLAETKDTKRNLSAYTEAEDRYLRGQVYLRAEALARIATTRRWEGPGKHAEESPVDEENPEQWAARVSEDPAYYIAGLMFSRVPILTKDHAKLDCPGNMLNSTWPVAYRLVDPPTAEIASTNQCGPAGDLAAGLGGYQILVRALPWAGTLQAVLIGDEHRVDRPRSLVRFPRPNAELSKTPSGQWLLHWESSDSTEDRAVLQTNVANFTPGTSPFNAGALGLEEYLEGLAAATGIPIISDGFRVPAVDKDAPRGGTTVAEWLEQLRKSQGCFVKVSDGSVLVRHGGFWALRTLEPAEEALVAFEQTESPGLNEYANFACALFPAVEELAQETDFNIPFFETEQAPLTRFDPKPLCQNYLALAAYGQWNDKGRANILSGVAVNTETALGYEQYPVIQGVPVKDQKGRSTIVDAVVGIEVKNHNWDRFVAPSATLGAFYGGKPAGALELKLLECTVGSLGYRMLWKDVPILDPAFRDKYGTLLMEPARFLLVPGGSASGPQSHPDSSRLYGKFTFFASESNDDGVYNSLDIPGPRDQK